LISHSNLYQNHSVSHTYPPCFVVFEQFLLVFVVPPPKRSGLWVILAVIMSTDTHLENPVGTHLF